MSKLAYYGYKISPNQLETDEGFLICKNVPIARTGDQQYLASELGMDGDAIITVHRPESEVFSDATIASFEGKPVTDNHPSELLDANNAMEHAKGHVQNVRRGVGEFDDYLLADLHVQDEGLIELIRNGKREVSCGYTVEYEDNGDGTFTQTHIRGNHVAVVDEGRAGHKAAIMDSNTKTQATKPEREHMKKNVWATLFGHAAEGKTADEITKMVSDTADALNADEEQNADACGTKATDEDYKDKLYESIDALSAKFDKVIDALSALAPKAQDEKDPIESALEEIEEKKEGEQPDNEEAVTVPAEEMDENADKADGMDKATVKAILTAVKPSIAAIQDDEQRKAVTDALLASIKTQKANDSAKIAQALATIKAPKVENNIEDVQNAYNALNPHMRKENK